MLENWGLDVHIFEQVYLQQGYFAGSDHDRLEALQTALDSTSFKAIFAARGGYGTTRIIDQLNFEQFQISPKWLIGFSDVTALHLQFARYDIPSIHGPMPVQFGDPKHEFSILNLKELLFKNCYEYELNSNENHSIPGKAEGLLTGGNLSLVCDSLGTSNEIQTEGKILFLEEIGEPIYRVDRMFHQLGRAGKFENIVGLILGQFTDISDSTPSFGKSIEQMIIPLIPNKIPISIDFPAGHESPNYPLVMNAINSLDVGASSTRLKYSGE